MNILILCTGNSARSILGEALFTSLSGGKITGYSAGSSPVGAVNPVALKLLQVNGHDVSNLSSKSWDEFSGDTAPDMAAVITVCSNAAGETCPIWPGAPVRAHWGFPDPAAVEGSDAEKMVAFEKVYAAITANIERFLDAYSSDMSVGELGACLRNAHQSLEKQELLS